jgi:LytS/YehU family sensor histidine kinase
MDLGIERSNLRKMGIVVLIVGVIMFFLMEGPLVARLVGVVVLGGISAASFMIVTALLDRIKPDY